MIVPVLLAGGSGTRLWPLSREARPKQFLPLVGERSLLEQTLRRVCALEAVTDPLIVGSEPHRFMIAEQMRRAGVTGLVLLEPARRNTAPAAAVAALEAIRSAGEDAVMLILPSDHAIEESDEFGKAVALGLKAAEHKQLVTFGVVPTAPETGYGYIRAGEDTGDGVRRIDAFVEKPDAQTAQGYLDAGGYFWNSGMFLFPARQYLDALGEHAPDILAACEKAHAGAQRDQDFLRVDAEAFAASREDSIDYAVMEKTRSAVVVPFAAEWNDLGSWASVREASRPDPRGNVTRGDVMLTDSDECLVHSDGRLVAVLGVKNHVIVETADAVLVAHESRQQDIKNVVGKLKQAERSEATEHRKMYRPWGSYESIARGERFQVKRIIVTPGGRLSLQQHHHRAEHWVVVRGTARVTRNGESFLLTEDQSTYLPLGAIHRLENPGTIPLELIEVQSGAYLGEDDIVRFEDVYGRAPEDSDSSKKESA